MSHIVEIRSEVRDPAAIAAACHRLHLSAPTRGTFKFYSGEASGVGVQLSDWKYPVVCDTVTGKVQYDNYKGHWGDQRELDRFVQAYAVEKAKIEARRKGYGVTEQSLTDGSIKLTVQVAQTGGAA